MNLPKALLPNHFYPSQLMSFFIASTNSCSSLAGFVSSNRRFTGALYLRPNPKFKHMADACPICKYPLGSGGNRKCKSPLEYDAFKSSSIICSIKLSVFFSCVMICCCLLQRAPMIKPFGLAVQFFDNSKFKRLSIGQLKIWAKLIKNTPLVHSSHLKLPSSVQERRNCNYLYQNYSHEYHSP